ncbi:crossover junction endodeoxyribonuclease RuvC [Coprothermobacteraceae bacterium]|nr:crossover junction endodeoxyribonuclease RuvC [Coprothermobacteraceae bacterium]
MVIVGVDPGSTRTGVAVFDSSKRKWLHVQSIELSGLEEAVRLVALEDYLRVLFEVFQPEDLAVERLVWGRNHNNLLQIAECRGVVKAVAYRKGMKIYEYYPTQVKAALSGYGQESKSGLLRFIQAETKFDLYPLFDDTSDAMALALVHSMVVNALC